MKVKITFNNTSKYYLGVGANHDFTGAVVKEGLVVSAIEAERINRLKHGTGGYNTFNSVLKYLFPNGEVCLKSLSTCDTLHTRNLAEYLPEITFYNHHLCHAASVFYQSPFEESAILVMDGLGSRNQDDEGNYHFETVSIYKGTGANIKEIHKVFGSIDSNCDEKDVYKLDIPNSLGIFYTYVTKLCDFKYSEDGKTMGLASYGNSNKYYTLLKKHFAFEGEKINIKFNESDFCHIKNYIYSDNLNTYWLNKCDIAAAGQRILEECILHYAKIAKTLTGCSNLCISGGVGLNSVANSEILKNNIFNDVFLYPACGDSSIAIGAALLSYYSENNKRVKTLDVSPFTGRNYTDEQIKGALTDYKVRHERISEPHVKAAELLQQNKIIGWFQGGSEIGPRALGGRSILANPSYLENRDKINILIKNRERFRPLAPAVLAEYQKDYFTLNKYNPYMLFVSESTEHAKKAIPSVIHVDGTARYQTVIENNIHFHKILTSFFKVSGLPVILNTSFNIIKGEPIVETPVDAIKSFVSSKLDCLIIGNYICVKE